MGSDSGLSAGGKKIRSRSSDNSASGYACRELSENRPWPVKRCYCGYSLAGLRSTTRNTDQDGLSHGCDSKQDRERITGPNTVAELKKVFVSVRRRRLSESCTVRILCVAFVGVVKFNVLVAVRFWRL